MGCLPLTPKRTKHTFCTPVINHPEGESRVSNLRKYTTGEARDRFSEVVNEAAYGAERVVLTRHGKDVAAVVPMSDLELLHELERIIDVEEARKALAEAKGAATITLNKLKEELDIE